jgi:hypothetical protein
MKPRIICWFSCGATSAVAAKFTLADYSNTHDVRVVCCDTRPSENSDNYRFSAEVEAWLGQPIEYIRNEKYATVDDDFEQTGYMSGPKGARCTVELKKKPRFAYQLPDDIHVFGFSAGEQKRIREFTQRNPELRLLWILQKHQLTKAKCKEILGWSGIALPAQYELGFDNNNCPGCVKVTSPWYWDRVRTLQPEVFRRRCEQSRKLGVRLVEIKHHVRIFLDELPTGPFKRIIRKERASCGPECGYTP